MHELHYTTLEAFLGQILVVATEAGLRLVAIGPAADALTPEGQPEPEYPMVRAAAEALGRFLDGSEDALRLPLDVGGTQFQRSVWDALRAIPRGETATYSGIAQRLGYAATSARAVGAACGANPVALAVPCHRAVGVDGTLHGYRWGLDVKRRLLEMEGAISPCLPQIGA